MLSKRALSLFLVSLIFLYSSACKKSAESPADAVALLIEVKQWKIDEIAVYDEVTFKDGKMTQQFGGIDFERYMETVELRKDGTFSGVFKGDSKPFILKWKQNDKNVTVGAAEASPTAAAPAAAAPAAAAPAAAKGGEWIIDPKDVSSEFFTMKTQSTAYDYPRMTSISLKFKAVK